MKGNYLIQKNKKRFAGFLLLFFFFLYLTSSSDLCPSPTKIRIIVDNATLKATPEIGAKNLARIPLNTILESQAKQGEWYKVSWEKEGTKLVGFIHEMLVKVVSDEEITEPGQVSQPETMKSQAEVIAEIGLRIEENRNLIRQEKKYNEALNSLSILLAKVFKISDLRRQKELAVEIFLLRGLAKIGQGDELAAVEEFKNMFEVSSANAKEATKNIYDPKAIFLLQQAERKYLGLGLEYTLIISTTPAGAQVYVDGVFIGLTPFTHKTNIPKFVLQIKIENFRPIQEEIHLAQLQTEKQYTLEQAGAEISIHSVPSGAKVYLDEKDTNQMTDCLLTGVPLGSHLIKIVKENYLEWEARIEIKEGMEPFRVESHLVGKNYVFKNIWNPSGKDLLSKPTGIAVDKENNIYVVDESRLKLKKFNMNGELFVGWEKGEPEVRDLKNPAGIAVDSEGYIYITDYKKHFILKLDKGGKFVARWGGVSAGKEELNTPLGIAVDRNNDVYVVDAGNSRIIKYNSQAELIKMWGKEGQGAGELTSPRAIAISRKNEVFVLDSRSVHKFSSQGDFLGSWEKRGAGDGKFNNPLGMAIDQDNYIYIADSANHRLQKFDESGRLIAKWGVQGKGNGQLNLPFGIVVANQGSVFVTDRENNRVQVFTIGQR